jgi:sterol carrier protein 2
MAPSPVYVIGVGMTKFVKPRGSKIDYPDLGFEAGIKALNDASVNYDDIEQGVACYAYGDSTCGQRVFYRFGMTGIPIHNVNNNCSTGSTGIFLAQQMCAGGTTHVFLVVGFEKMFPGSLQTFFKDRASPLDKTMMMMAETNGIDGKAPAAAQLFGNGGREYMQKYGATKEDFAEIARVNHEHSQRNPYSQFRDVYTHQEILSSPKVWDPLTKLQWLALFLFVLHCQTLQYQN